MSSEETIRKIEEYSRGLYEIAATCGEEEANIIQTKLRSIKMRLNNRFIKSLEKSRNLGLAVANASPKSKPARSRNMDTARLSRLSSMIVKKLGREPMPGDLVALGAKSYIFGGAPGGAVVVSVQEKGEIMECAFNWKNGRLERI